MDANAKKTALRMIPDGLDVLAAVQSEPPGRPDEATLWLKAWGEKIF